MSRTHDIFQREAYEQLDNFFHQHYATVAEQIEGLTNSPDFAVGLLRTLLAAAEANKAREDEIHRRLAKHLYG